MKTKIQFRKLDARGFSHDIGIVVFAVIFAIVGVGYLVASHADNCTPVSGATSSAASNPSCPATGPAQAATGSCTIAAVPASATYSQQISPSVTFTNTGSQSFSTVASGQITIVGDTSSTPSGNGLSIKAVTLNPGQSLTVDTGLRYTPGYSSSSAQRVSFTVSNSSPAFSCSAGTALPTAPVVPTPTPKPVLPEPAPAKLAAICSIKGILARPAYRQVLRPYVIVSNTGSVAFQPKIVGHFQVGNSTSTAAYTLGLLRSGGSAQQGLKQYVTQRHSGNTTQASYRVTSAQPNFSCSATFKLP